jgi:hypothetical protein
MPYLTIISLAETIFGTSGSSVVRVLTILHLIVNRSLHITTVFFHYQHGAKVQQKGRVCI